MKTLFQAFQQSSLDIMAPGNCCLCGSKLYDNEIVKMWKNKPAHATCRDNYQLISSLTAKEAVVCVEKLTDIAILHNLYTIETLHQDRLTVLRAINNRIEKLIIEKEYVK
jgi:hypothetical protein